MGWRRKMSFYRRSKIRSGMRQMSPGQLAQEGRRFEEKVVQVLHQMQQRGQIESFVYHLPHSREDREGKDFTVAKIVNGQRVELSFGISISQSRIHRSQEKHPNMPQLHIPLSTREEHIPGFILTLFPSESPTPASPPAAASPAP